MEENEKLNSLILEIKKNKKYKSLSNEIILEEIKIYFKNKELHLDKQIIKEIRKNLHRTYSSYQTQKKNKIKKYLEELKQNPKDKLILRKLLSLTRSTKERLEDYSKIYKRIFSITKLNNSNNHLTILDLGSGLNPFSLPLSNLDLSKITYFAYDIDEKDINNLNEFFKIINLQGSAEIFNLNNLSNINKLPKADIIFMFKVLDLLKTNKQKLINQLITKTNFLVISFATKTLSGRPMQLQQRTGFENNLKTHNLDFQTFSTKNEIFYVIWR